MKDEILESMVQFEYVVDKYVDQHQEVPINFLLHHHYTPFQKCTNFVQFHNDKYVLHTLNLGNDYVMPYLKVKL